MEPAGRGCFLFKRTPTSSSLCIVTRRPSLSLSLSRSLKSFFQLRVKARLLPRYPGPTYFRLLQYLASPFSPVLFLFLPFLGNFTAQPACVPSQYRGIRELSSQKRRARASPRELFFSIRAAAARELSGESASSPMSVYTYSNYLKFTNKYASDTRRGTLRFRTRNIYATTVSRARALTLPALDRNGRKYLLGAGERGAGSGGRGGGRR